MATCIGDTHPDTALLAERLRKVAVGEIVTYAELRDCVGYGVQDGPGQGRLASARRQVQRDDGIVFGCERGEGLVHLTPDGVVNHAESGIESIRRKAFRQQKALATVTGDDYLSLAPTDKARWNACMALASAVKQMTREPSRKKLIQRVADSGEPARLSMRQTLAVFTNGNGESKTEE